MSSAVAPLLSSENATGNQTFDENFGFNNGEKIDIVEGGHDGIACIIILLVLMVIIVGTIVGNVLVCVAVCLVRKLRKPCNYLLVSLAISDLCVAVLVMPLAMVYEVSGRWTLGPIICNVWVSVDVLSCTASILNLCMISVDRYWAITKPLAYGTKRTPKRMLSWIVIIWCVAGSISLPPLLIIGNEHVEITETGRINKDVCLVSQHFAYQLYATLFSFYIPLIVMILVYLKIFRAARRIVREEKKAQNLMDTHYYLSINVANTNPTQAAAALAHNMLTTNVSKRKNDKSASKQNERKTMDKQESMKTCSQINESSTPTVSDFRTRRSPPNVLTNIRKVRFQLAKERKASTTLGIIMSAFIICWLPFFLLALVRPFLHSSDTLKLLGSVFLWLGYTNSLLNPIIYATLNRDFRRPFQAILYFQCGKLNHMMREEYYHSQYGDPKENVAFKAQHARESIVVQNRDLDGDQIHIWDVSAPTHESFL